jgi:thiol-disulfide isomerase/thioredoxin
MSYRWLAATLITLLAIPSAFAANDVKSAATPVAAERFSLTDSRGRSLRSAGLEGKVVLLDFWATWCTGCKEEMPWFMAFQKRYGAQGLASIGVSLDEDGWTSVRAYLAAHPINYPVSVANQDFAKRYGFQGALPVTVLIDRAGRIAEVHQGKVDKDAFEAHLRLLLRER